VKKSNYYEVWSRNENDRHTLVTTDKEVHARKRRLLNQAFTDRSVKPSGTFMAKHIDRWLELLGSEDDAEGQDGWSEARDISHWAAYLVFDILGDLCFGVQFNSKEPGEDNEFKNIPLAFDAFFKFGYAFARSPALDLVLWLKPRGLDKFSEILGPKIIKDYYTFVEETVRQRVAIEQQREAEKQPVQRADMFHFLYHAKDPDTGKPAFDFRDLLAEANLLILAGSDTTAITISGLFFYLTHNERVYRKLVKEIRNTFISPEDIVHSPELLNSPYLCACIDEALRMAHIVPSEFLRVIRKGGMEIDGHFYPEGVLVGCPNWAMYRNEEFFGDATTFRPERWIVSDHPDTFNSEEQVRRLKRGLNPFLKGPGDCVGQKMAILELCMVTARTLWRFDISLAPGTHAGEGKPALGWGRRDANQFMLGDAFMGLREGPMVSFRPRRY
jgi:cytochrome P450